MTFTGRVEAIHLAPARGAPAESVNAATAVAGAGLRGDRHFGRSKNGRPCPERAITLIEAETLEALARDHDLPLTAAESRRNVLTRGVPLNHLVGRRFRVGPVLCEGVELCEPCAHLERMTRKGVLKALLHRGGLCAKILEGGSITVGDPIEPA